ncbi:MAG TPA: ABC transporter ATP-binding protein, partial [Egibacteraceae bacterium]|nr:ABC transporter ATP-binding protein [Egibacteraceae bacterium]
MSAWELLWRVAGYRPGLFAANCAVWGLGHALPLVLGLAVRGFFDALSGEAPAGANYWTFLAAIVAFGASRAGTIVGGVWLWATYWFTITGLLRRNLMEWLVEGPGARSLPEAPGEAVNRFRDDVEEALTYIESWVDLWGAGLFVVLGLAVMFAVSPTMTGAAVLPLAGVVLLMSRMGPRLRAYRRASREATGRVTEFVGEVFGAVQAIKVASAETRAIGHLEELNESRRKAMVRDRLFGELVRSLGHNMANVGVGVILLLAAETMRAGAFTVGDFALFALYLGRMAGWVGFLTTVVTQHKRVPVSLDRLDALLPDAPPRQLVKHAPIHTDGPLPDVPEPTASAADRLNVLEVRGLTARHDGGERGIERATFQVQRGEMVVVTGRIGSGKTTLLRAMLGLVPRQAGEILWNGRAIEDPATFLVPPQAAYTPQVPRLFSETLRENILMGL